MSFLPFVAVDVETANYDCTNICQFGYAKFANGVIAACEATLINPHCEFEPRFIHIHGITRDLVTSSPTWDVFHPGVKDLLNSEILLSHTHFDRDALNKACWRYHLLGPMPRFWIDTCAVARRVWPELPNHKLPTLAAHFDISYNAHNAADDARCAGEILLLAIQHSGETMEHIMSQFITGHQQIKIRSTAPKTSARRPKRALPTAGQTSGSIHGQVLPELPPTPHAPLLASAEPSLPLGISTYVWWLIAIGLVVLFLVFG